MFRPLVFKFGRGPNRSMPNLGKKDVTLSGLLRRKAPHFGSTPDAPASFADGRRIGFDRPAMLARQRRNLAPRLRIIGDQQHVGRIAHRAGEP